MAELRDYELEAARAWLQSMRGETSQEVLAEDITRTTGWTITRDRYSKYESGSLPFGKVVLGHFVAYWTAKGRPAPDFTPPPPQLSLEKRAVIAAEAQVQAIRDQTDVWRELVNHLRGMRAEAGGAADAQMSALALIAEALGTRLPGGTGAADAGRSPVAGGQ